MKSRPGHRKASLQHTSALAVLIVVLFGAIGACTDILGITDRQLTSSGAGGDGGDGGNGGAGASDGTCTTDEDCAGSPYGEKCDPSTDRCVECLPLPDENICSLGLFCDVTKTCQIGCAADADCNPQGSGPLVCNTETHQCEGCSADVSCPPGSKCELATGTCVPGCDQTSECPNADWACCLKQCKNITKDLQNCGACEEQCLPDVSTVWLCLDGGCVFQLCNNGWANCDQNQAKGNGCEVNTDEDPAHCGGCNTQCDLPHAAEGCAAAVCNIQSCEAGFGDCNDKTADGCETNLNTTVAHCGACKAPCPGFPNGDAECTGGKCTLGECETGFGNCDENGENGCETDVTDNDQHCGACNSPCVLDHAVSECTAGACAVVSCDTGFEDCNGEAEDGCEAHLATDRMHCGACDADCSFENATGICTGGSCTMGPCLEGWANCNTVLADGCEVNTNTDVLNCGECGTECAAANGVPSCSAGTCELACNPGFDDCDGLAANGCEADLTSSVATCGACDAPCPTSGGTPYCFNSMCGVSNCSPGTANCDGNPNPLCETDVTTPLNCGQCGNKCSTTNGTPSCNGSTCSITCNAGYGDCNDNVADGCEQPLNTNIHCTGCDVPCMRPHAFTSCGNGSCEIVSCEDGWADCNENPSDGCEKHIAEDEANCGGCGSICSPPNAVGLCVAGACTVASCLGAFENCNGGVVDGCEVNTNNNPDNCGGCGDACNLPNANSICSGGACQITSCLGTYANCDNLHPNGCEVNLQTNVDHCGTCTTDCSSTNGAPTCAGGQCGISCNAGFGNCNGNVGDGCETPLDTNANCGQCGVGCNLLHATESCATGTCQIVSCDAGFTNCDSMTATGCECPGACAGGVCQGCGDGTCNSGAGENCTSCPQDCTCLCPNTFCEAPGETCSSCPQDCGSCCGNGSCQTGIGESCTTCPADCGSCCGNGSCQSGETCASCQQDCGPCGPTCGNSTCEGPAENCTNCPSDCPSCCGDGMCGPGEDCMSCGVDCTSCCGDGACLEFMSENCQTCSTDCPSCFCGDGLCDPGGGEDCMNCPSDCTTCCGDGTCGPGEDCMICGTDCTSCCGDGACLEFMGENCQTCSTDCPSCFCGDGLCDTAGGENCVNCNTDCTTCCGDGLCDPSGAEDCMSCGTDCTSCCGDGSCHAFMGENCQTCSTDCPSCFCGDGLCDPGGGENCLNCNTDCTTCCGDGLCDPSGAEDCMSCGTDCTSCCGDGTCHPFMGENCQTCSTDCPSCFCGDGLCDPGMGEDCGSCPDDCPTCVCGDGLCTPPEECDVCVDDCGTCGAGGGGGGGGGDGGAGGSTGGTGGAGGSGGSTTTSSSTSGLCGANDGALCNGTDCFAGCCHYGSGMQACTDPTMCMALSGKHFQCDEEADCAPGQVCCEPTTGGSFCTTTCDPPSRELCGGDAGKPASCKCDVPGDTCCAPSFPLYPYPNCQPGAGACAL